MPHSGSVVPDVRVWLGRVAILICVKGYTPWLSEQGLWCVLLQAPELSEQISGASFSKR